MIRFALLGVALISVSLVLGESEPDELVCAYDEMFFEVGYKFYEGCEKCKCTASGVVKCSKGTACCLYADKKGRTKRAYPGDSYNDGCNNCRCGEGGLAGCTKMACPDKCMYKNWELVSGYAKKGKIDAYDEEEQCPKQCKCKVKKGRATLKCNTGCIYNN